MTQRWTVKAGEPTHRATLAANGRVMDVSIGRAGIAAQKREGDGATPAGIFRLRRMLWRADRLARPRTRLPGTPILPHLGWCDDPANFHYNTQIHLPWPASAEALWRMDHLYDVILVISHNQDPVVPGAGSAVFVHLERPDKGPTAGCVALQLPDLLSLLKSAGPETELHIG